MSYSKFHNLEEAIINLNTKLAQDGFHFSVSFKSDFYETLSLAYLCQNFVKNSLDFNCTITEAINHAKTDDSIKRFLGLNLIKIENQSFSLFNKVTIEEAESYILNFFEYISPREQLAVMVI